MTENNAIQAHHTLGPLLREHRLRRELAILYPTLAILGLSGTAIAAVWTAWRWLFAFNNYGAAAIWRWTTPALLTALGFASLGILGLILTWRSRGFRINLHTLGMVYRRGRYKEKLLWNQIQHVHTSAVSYGFSNIAWGAKTILKIHTSDGRQLHLTHALTDMNGLVEFIKSQVYPGLLEEYRRKYNQGDPLSFGPLILTAKGVQREDQMLQWEDLGRISLGRGMLSLETIDGQRIRIPAHRVPNVEICTQLIEHLRSRQGANHSVNTKKQL
ncbi:MAG TPA: hypothetical protein G4O14_12045 [Anaerolineae bacterium]|nr:hypothetical protein [Anaerolineae bacterium]